MGAFAAEVIKALIKMAIVACGITGGIFLGRALRKKHDGKLKSGGESET